MYVAEGGQSTSLEFYKINTGAAEDIDNILSNPQEVYASFVASRDVDVDTIDPLDLQSHQIAKLQMQRRDLLQELHLADVADSMRQPALYFEAITSSFFDQCGQDRLVWGRVRHSADGVVEVAHTGTFRRDQNGIIEPELRGRITYVTPHNEERSQAGVMLPQAYELVTDLHHAKPNTHYRFYTSDHSANKAQNGLAIEEVTGYGTSEATYTPVTDVVDHFTLLQALTVDLYAAVTDVQHENDSRAKHVLAIEVYGARTPR